ncbi:predicted protein [Nematostella vectensis]|uniref:G-protein coupled receptors family 1 profile domain-containing protein n=1 Tax=Nematostella vectensis TaxID=45351 RepID=A7RS06_NEMVE|nr:predicted protein [Nematostella vectensis]|eukprot:XP_001637781.1 predicted protein [Nematostella vectensis]
MENTTNTSCPMFGKFAEMLPFPKTDMRTKKNVVLVQAILHGATCPFTITLNFLIILVLLKARSLRSNANIMCGLLASVDLLAGWIIQPSLVAEHIMYYSTDQYTCFGATYHYYTHRVLLFVSQILSLSSLHHLTLLNIDRYIGMKETLRYPVIVTQQRVVFGVVCAWLLATLLSLNVFYSALFLPMNISVLVCFSFCIYCSVVVTHESRRHQRQIVTQHRAAGLPLNALQKRRANWVFIFLTLALLLTYFIAGLMRAFRDRVPNILQVTTSLFTLNALLNPVIFILRCEDFRIALRGILEIDPGRVQPHGPT